MTLGAALPVGALIVHSDGVDFTVLEPAQVAVAMSAAARSLRIRSAWSSSAGCRSHRWLATPRGPSLGPTGGATAVLVVALVDVIGDLTVLA